MYKHIMKTCNELPQIYKEKIVEKWSKNLKNWIYNFRGNRNGQ